MKTIRRRVWILYIIASCGLLFVFSKRISFNPWERWQNHEINVEFQEHITKVTPTRGDVLEVAQVESYDTISRRDSRMLFDDLIYLGTTVSEIKVKVTYRYHILLSDKWKLELKNSTLNVMSPQIRPSLPPAIHTDQMEKRTESGWLRFNAQENLDKLEQSLTPTLAAMSVTPAKMILVSDAAKKSVAEFVNSWILSQEKWKNLSIDQVEVYFPGD